ncbi:CCA tRNA nucleotidyltransferase [Deinococcus puniceus]|uniref:tRNA nucleotidyltransferase n=1 Tax=Deinococcus puniceus TaxID=1182568 RepID=A0A172T8D2_9DEIO|nr:HD domain-containing protein [Deinococcus puniceus]ANE43207.1 tRNA nucleotidyltransferase [Deinococcus puniceus]
MFRRSRAALAQLPTQTWPTGGLLVGGAARDILRGVTPGDYDWVVPDPIKAAIALAQAHGGSAFPLDQERGYWRVHLPDGVQHDFVPLPDDLNADLLRRDFTVNAMALDAAGQLHDLTGGQGDLRARRLRMVSAANLHTDSLRAWRAARFEVTLGFRTDAATEQTVREVAAALAAGRLTLPAPERVREELHALLGHRDAARGILRLEELGLLALTVPELREGIGVAQGGFHHLDVFGHGVEALHQLLVRFADAPLPLRWAALLHDVGKPRAHALSGGQNFYGHDKLGAEITREVLARLKLPGDDTARAASLVGAHMLPLPQNDTEARRFVHRRRVLLPDLLALMLADREAARGPSSSPASRHAYAAALDRVLAALKDQPAAPKPLLTGSEIIALLDIEPGPKVGQALRALNEAAALGDVKNPQDARAFVQNWAAHPPSNEAQAQAHK